MNRGIGRLHASTAATVRARKEAQPWLYCGDSRCLWFVGADTGKPCPKHPAAVSPLPPRGRVQCEYCGKLVAVKDDGEMHAADPRVALLCWSDERTATFCDRDPKRPGAPHPDRCGCGDCIGDRDRNDGL